MEWLERAFAPENFSHSSCLLTTINLKLLETWSSSQTLRHMPGSKSTASHCQSTSRHSTRHPRCTAAPSVSFSHPSRSLTAALIKTCTPSLLRHSCRDRKRIHRALQHRQTTWTFHAQKFEGRGHQRGQGVCGRPLLAKQRL